ncbi:MAG: hypothetical protein NTW87_31865 [Planctomycetota bacterium]|nr:hypothetical protein [Planctomycetota bacterium]
MGERSDVAAAQPSGLRRNPTDCATLGEAGPWLALWRRLRANRAALVSLWFLVLLACAAVAAPLIAPYGYQEQFRGAEIRPPLSRALSNTGGGEASAERVFFLGTDHNARDTFSRLIYGARVSLAVGIVAAIIALAVGIAIGLLSGFYAGPVDTALMRFTDTVFAFPSVLLAVAITAVFDKPSLWALDVLYIRL